ncbi:MAG: outer membrane beta-barrel protein [Alphaproteobacteria bacterium]|nr:outer membrane beta-barrel protein [Alphaproteobacteria bacterium]
MNKFALLATTAAVAFAVAPANADDRMTPEDNHLYVGLSAGGNWLHDTSAATAFSSTVSIKFDTGYALVANVGYHWSNGLRAELEAAYRDNTLGQIADTTPLGRPDGDVTQFSLMANALYDVRLADDIDLSLGGGIGAADARIDLKSCGGPGSCPTVQQLIVDAGNDWSFAWQLLAGLSYAMSPNTDVFVEYRYMRNDNHDVITYPNGTPLRQSVDLQNDTVTVGIRLSLGR